ncbi:hypothetical protein DITRI_Ditri07aG0028700 [Diplodiscus trichospermus]
MGISTRSCGLNVSPPSSSPGLVDISSSKYSKASQVAWPRDDKWRKQCVLGVASMIIGLQMGDIYNSNAIAEELSSSVVAKSNSGVVRWSDERMCPPWQANSLETIVPENLPRPSAQRRWEAIGNSTSKNAPSIKVTVARKSRSSCFSM